MTNDGDASPTVAATDGGATQTPGLEPPEWNAGGRRLPIRARTVGFLLTVAVIVGAYGYETLYVHPAHVPPWGWSPGYMGYLLYLSEAVVVFYLLVPLARRRALMRRYWRRLRARPSAVAALGGVAAFVLVGTFGPGLVNRLGVDSSSYPYPTPRAQPPVFETFPAGGGIECLGDVVAGRCHGTWDYPLGTTLTGDGVVTVTVEGTRVALEIALVSAAIIVPIATVVGSAAAYYGGWTDRVLMRLVEIVQVIPAVLLVIIFQEVLSRGIFTIVVLFGLLEWGTIARLVRSEALQRVDEQYVTAARSAGASDLAIVRRHVFPNVSSTVVTAVTALMPKLVIIEASIAFIGFTDPFSRSWGASINQGLSAFPTVWWDALIPAAALILVAASLHVLGDALRDVLDPRMGGPG